MADNLLLQLVCDYGLTVKQGIAWMAVHADPDEPLKTLDVARRMGRDQSGLSQLLLRAAHRADMSGHRLPRHRRRGRPKAYFKPQSQFANRF